ncbi:MAG TPA: Maf family nucleotide pyrophosphatase [Wenzhouxiangella sp.]
MKIVLASSSVYRRALLERLNVNFEVMAPEIDETPVPGESGRELATRLAHQKAQAVAQSLGSTTDTVVIGSDQVAEANAELLGKPMTEDRAIAQLLRLSGQTVVFHTAMALISGDTVIAAYVPTTIQMRALDAAEVTRYVRHDQPLHCAGAMKTESLGITLMQSFSSDDPTAIIGLPLISLSHHLRALGLQLP